MEEAWNRERFESQRAKTVIGVWDGMSLTDWPLPVALGIWVVVVGCCGKSSEGWLPNVNMSFF